MIHQVFKLPILLQLYKVINRQKNPETFFVLLVGLTFDLKGPKNRIADMGRKCFYVSTFARARSVLKPLWVFKNEFSLVNKMIFFFTAH